MSDDPGDSCGNCKYYRPNPNNLREGNCQRFPPTPILMPQGAQLMVNYFFPNMKPIGWCGEHKRKVVLQ
jgi:hypothetical protein